MGERSKVVGCTLILVLAWVSACSQTRSPKQKMVRVGLANDVISLDRARVGDITSWSIIYNVVENLTEVDPENRSPRPCLAERWEISPDRKSISFSLRPNVRFHNGKLMEAEDVAYSIRRFLDPKTAAPVRQWLDMVDSVEVLDKHHVRLRLSRPDPNVLTALAVVPGIIPAGWAEQASDPGAVVGTGPFRYVRWERGRELVLERFAQYWGGPPRVDGVIFRVVPNENARVMALKNGELDLILSNSLTPTSVSDLVRAGFHLEEIPALGQQYLGFDHSVPPFSNRTFRQAIAAAIDRRAIVENLLQGRALLAQGPLPKIFPEHNPEVQDPPFDPVRARQLVVESGVKLDPDRPLELAYGTEWPWNEQLAQVLEANLRAVGIPIIARKYEWSTFVSGLFAHKYPFFTVDIFAGNGDFQLFLGDLFRSDSNLNFFNYKNPDFDLCLSRAEQLEGEARRRMIARAQQILVEDVAAIFLFNPKQGFVRSPRLRNVRPGALQELILKRAEIVGE